MPRPEPTLALPELPRPDNLELPVEGGPVTRPDPELIEQLKGVSSATASANLHKLGLRNSWIQGPVARQRGRKITGPAVTLALMPQREDLLAGPG